MTTKHLPCTCHSEYQDKAYHGKRLHNDTADGWRCTVCGKEKGKSMVRMPTIPIAESTP